MNRATFQRAMPVARTTILICLIGFFALTCTAHAAAAGRYLEVSYPSSAGAGELQLGVTYTLWIPDGVAKIRGVIVHQHGCGSGACKGGATAAYDLHWQALAKKWDCALLGPSYHQDDKQNCRLWCDPRNGSDKTFLKAIDEFAAQSKHPELKSAPWCLWGHSGGAFWASLMQTMHPERIVAIWFRSGTAYSAWEKGEIARPEIPAAAYDIPMMCNPGGKEKDDKRFAGAWTGSMAMFLAYRVKGAPVGFAPDPRTAHECGDSRYLAIPFFDACLELRLPAKGSKTQKLQPIEMKSAWLATLLSDKAEPAFSYAGKVEEASWLPNERVAKAWAEYVKTGAVGDNTPPPAPFQVKAVVKNDQVEITWDAEADFESGIKGFIIQRDGKDLAQVPEKGVGRFGRALFQTMSYHDTPEKPLPEMRYIDRTAKSGVAHEYQVIAINSVGLQSKPAQAKKQVGVSIDAHVHVWTPDVTRYPLAAGFKKENMQPASFTPEELFKHCKPAGVGRINLIQMSFYGFDNSYMLDMIAKYPDVFVGTAVIDPLGKDPAHEMGELAKKGVRAFRIYPTLTPLGPPLPRGGEGGWLRPEGYKKMFAAGARNHQAMACLIGPDALPELDRMCKEFPDTPVIIDHLARIGADGEIRDADVDRLCAMAKHKKVMVKVGAFYALGKKQSPYTDLAPMIKKVVTAFGPRRCMWESDCPFQVQGEHTYQASVDLVRQRLDFLSNDDKEWLMRKTAEGFFFTK
jgi:predicted TIM-barrel fold metal-dependent hydrolase/poly(3-hydroxybutyrate) depolymerase